MLGFYGGHTEKDFSIIKNAEAAGGKIAPYLVDVESAKQGIVKYGKLS